jgi:hypothetical protein
MAEHLFDLATSADPSNGKAWLHMSAFFSRIDDQSRALNVLTKGAEEAKDVKVACYSPKNILGYNSKTPPRIAIKSWSEAHIYLIIKFIQAH